MGRKSKFSFEEKLSAVKGYLDGTHSISQVSTIFQVNSSTVEQWVSLYRTRGAAGLQNLPINTCYPNDIKIQAINDCLEGKASLREISIKYYISDHCILARWKKSYNGHEAMKPHNSKGGKIMTSGRTTTYEERVEIVSFCIENNDNYQLTAEKYKVSYQQVYTWIRKYKEGGSEALADRRGKRKDSEGMTESERFATHVRLLEADNKRLQMEVGFLKKLKEVERMRTGNTSIQPSENTTKKPDSQ